VIKHYGFEFPPVGIMGIIDQMVPATHKIYIVDPIACQEFPYQELGHDCWVVITTNEGSSHHWFDRLIPTLRLHGVPFDQIVIRSSCLWDPESPVKHIHTIVDEASDFVTLHQKFVPDTKSPTHHYVCLNNGHRWQRYQLVTTLLNRGLDHYGHISYLQKPNQQDQRFPIVISQSTVSWHEQRSLELPELRDAMLNVVTETAYEPNPVSPSLVHHHRPGMTEKSYKCFALYQIPIWLAPYRAVECYRNLGFDVFDDIIDHSYDLESDPVLRIGMVADQIEKFCQQPIATLSELKINLEPRLKKNWQKLKHYAHNFDTEKTQWASVFPTRIDNAK
jgi:hypothetical protein